MDQPRSQSEPAQAQHRDMMYCHLCHDEWYRDQHGLTCPECGSDFTEIIEDNNDPRDDPALAHAHGHDHGFDDDDDDDEDMPALEEAPPFVPNLNERNPWREHNDPSESDLSNLQWRQVGPGRFAVTGTMYRTMSPDEFARGGGAAAIHGPGAMGGFAALLNNIVGGALGGAGTPHPPPGAQNAQNAAGQDMPRSGSGTTPEGHRFTYTAGARLHPRDEFNQGPRIEPVGDLSNLLVGIMAAFGERPGAHRGPDHPLYGMPEADQMPDHGVNPLLQFMFQNMIPGGQHGDAVYSQEALDRIITQLMEQNATSNAPGPASQTDIESLPRKPVSIEMLGDDGRADCSICMDEVNIGEEVAELPCHHWFHHQCISAWLGEHDTCPHCRVGISKHDAQNSGQGGNNTSNTSGGATPSRTMPGAFGGATGEGTPHHPFVFPDSPSSAQRNPASPEGGDRPQSAEGGSGGGIGERIRRGLFGSPR